MISPTTLTLSAERPSPTMATSSTLQTPMPTSRQHLSEDQRVTLRSTAQHIVPREEECWPVAMLMERYPELRFERWLPGVLRSIRKANGTVYDERLLRGPRGHPLCLWCSKETETLLSLFCASPHGRPYLATEFGEGCVHEHRMRRDNQYVRQQLFLRDGGVCYDCGIDTHALFVQAIACATLNERIAMFRMLARRAPEWRKKVKRPLASMEYEFTEGMFWEAAHKVDVKHGGGLCGLDGFQTLCVPCHCDEYMRNYLADISSMSLFQSPTGVASDAATPLSAQPAARPRSALSPIQPSRPRTAAATCPLATPQFTPVAALASCGRTVAEVSPISISSTSSSSLPSPTSTYILCAPPRPRMQGLPSGSPVADQLHPLGSVCYRRAGNRQNATPSKPPPGQSTTIIDLTMSTRRLDSHLCDRQDLSLLANMLTTINISSSGEESSDEVEIVHVAPTRQPLATRKQGNDSARSKAEARKQTQATAANIKDTSAVANESRQARTRLVQKSMSENAATLCCPSRTRVLSSRPASFSQENSPAARGLAPLSSDTPTSRRQLKDSHTTLS
ncbi:hypothetical protein GGI20_005348 [Coemansia sp. BCRC 34301]|nr:hypothetical protein GGI20_005348 [Coemansia sp. BCRC 34301]